MKRLLLVGLAGVFSSTIWASDLLETYQQALQQDARFAAAQAQLEAGREKEIQARSALLPNIGASATVQSNRLEPKGLPDQTYSSHSWGVQLTQPLYRPQAFIQADQGALQTGLAELQFEQARQGLALRVAEAYFAVLSAQEVLDAVTQLRIAAEEQRQIAKTSFDVGTVTITDVHEAQSRYDLALSQVIAAESQLDVAQRALEQLVGQQRVTPLAVLRKGVELQAPAPAEQSAWVARAEKDNLGVKMREILYQIAGKEVSRRQAGHHPTLDLLAKYGHAKRQNGPQGEATAGSVGVQLNVPLYTGGGLSSLTREAVALKVKAEADLEDARRSAALGAKKAYVGVKSGMARVAALEAATVSSQSALEANQLGYEVGVRINIDVLNSITQLANAKRELAQARYSTLLAQLQLKAAVGQLDQSDLAAINALLVEPTSSAQLID